MPSVKVCLWNVQNYGSGDPSRKFGDDSFYRNRFIRDFVRAKNVDVLMIMEVSQHAADSLQDLMERLNYNLAPADRDWAFSFCGSAIKAHANNPLQGAGDIGFSTDARSEGYAVFWRTNQAARFSVLPSLVNVAVMTSVLNDNPNPPATTPLNFVTTGRPAEMVAEHAMVGRKRRIVSEEFRPTGGYLPDEEYPYDDEGDLMEFWPDLDLPTTSVLNPSQLSWERSRRPAYVVLELNNGGTQRQRLCPVGVYHAPSNRAKAGWGAFMSGLSRELYVTNALDMGGAPDPNEFVHVDKTVLGGDYNYSVEQADWPADYKFYTRDFDGDWDGGAEAGVVPPSTAVDTDRRSTVQLLAGDHTTPIVGANTTDYLRHKIDLAFFRPKGVVTGQRVNVLDGLINDNLGTAATLTDLYDHLNTFVGNLPADADHRMTLAGVGPQQRVRTKINQTWQWVWKPMLSGSWGSSFVNWTTFMTQLQAGHMTAARQAAELYHIFVSDHLPLVIDIPL